jgi:hypothetical protein
MFWAYPRLQIAYIVQIQCGVPKVSFKVFVEKDTFAKLEQVLQTT